MTDRDAFGRPIAGPAPTVASLSKGGPAPTPAPGGRPPRDRAGLRRLLWWFVAVDLIAIVAVAFFLLRGSEDDTVVLPPKTPITQPSDAGDASTGDRKSERSADEKSSKPVAPAGFNAASLLRPTNFQRALSQARAMGQGKPMMVRVEASRIDLQLRRPSGAMVLMQVPAGGPPTIVTTVAGAARSRKTMPWAAIQPSAPRRLARATGSTRASGSSSTAYVVFLEQTRQWVLYRKSGTGYIADANGRGGMRIPGT